MFYWPVANHRTVHGLDSLPCEARREKVIGRGSLVILGDDPISLFSNHLEIILEFLYFTGKFWVICLKLNMQGFFLKALT